LVSLVAKYEVNKLHKYCSLGVELGMPSSEWWHAPAVDTLCPINVE